MPYGKLEVRKSVIFCFQIAKFIRRDKPHKELNIASKEVVNNFYRFVKRGKEFALLSVLTLD